MSTISNALTAMNNIRMPTGNLGYGRQFMPQIDNLESTLDKLCADGIDCNREVVRVDSLHLVQNEINRMKAFKLMQLMDRKKKTGPIVISNDNYVIDGSHRFVAKYNMQKDRRLKAVRIDMPASDLIDYFRDNSVKYGITYRNYSDSTLKQ